MPTLLKMWAKSSGNTGVTTYNSRYPGFNKDDYDKLENMVTSKGLTGNQKTQMMDQLYQYYSPQVFNSHKLDERQIEINNMVYENGNNLVNGSWDASQKLKLTNLSQMAKQKFGIAYDTPDDEVINAMVNGIDNWNQLLYNYIKNWDTELLYQAWIYDREVKQGWIKSLINPASEWWILPEKGTEWLNPLGAVTETVDNAANKFAESIMITGNKSAENLKKEIDNMSQEEISRLREEYNRLVDAVDQDDNYSIGEIAADTWKLLWLWTAWLYDKLVTAWQGNLGDVALSKAWDIANKMRTAYKKEDGWFGVDKSKAKSDEAFLDRVIDQKANLWQSLIGADDILRWETNPNVIRFFWNIPGSALKTFTATVRWMTNPYDTLKGLYTLAATEEWHQAILNRYGSWEAFANSMNSDPVWVADDMLAVAELWWNIVGGGLKAVGKMTWNSSLTNAWNFIKANNVWSANDVLAQKTVGSMYGGLDKLAWMTDNKFVQLTNRYIQDTSSLQKLTENAKTDLKAIENSDFWQSIKNAYDEAVNKIVWIDEADREFIRENKDLVNENLSKKKNVETIFDDVKEKVSEKRLENSDMGKEYEVLRNNKKKVVNTEWITSDMKAQLKKNWITIDKNWDLKFDDLSKFNAKQRAALTDAWNELKFVENKKNINAWNVLDMRQKFDDMLNRDGKAMDLNGNLSAVDKATEGLIQDMRWVIDNRAKSSVEWLAELDAKYGDAMAEMQQIKKDWLNPDWTFKDNARSKLRNLTKAWNEEKLARLEQVIPWITRDLKALDVALTIEKASKQWVWQYSKGILAWSVPAWIANPVAWAAWVVLWVLSSPKNYVKLIEIYPDIAQKISAWQELLPSDLNKLSSLSSRLADTVEE